MSKLQTLSPLPLVPVESATKLAPWEEVSRLSSTLLAVAASSLSIKWIPELVDGVVEVKDGTGGDNVDEHSVATTSSFEFNSSELKKDLSVSLDSLFYHLIH